MNKLSLKEMDPMLKRIIFRHIQEEIQKHKPYNKDQILSVALSSMITKFVGENDAVFSLTDDEIEQQVLFNGGRFFKTFNIGWVEVRNRRHQRIVIIEHKNGIKKDKLNKFFSLKIETIDEYANNDELDETEMNGLWLSMAEYPPQFDEKKRRKAFKNGKCNIRCNMKRIDQKLNKKLNQAMGVMNVPRVFSKFIDVSIFDKKVTVTLRNDFEFPFFAETETYNISSLSNDKEYAFAIEWTAGTAVETRLTLMPTMVNLKYAQ